MKQFRHLMALLVSLTLLSGLALPAVAQSSSAMSEPPPQWTSTQTYDWYTVLQQSTERGTGGPATQVYSFEVKANVAKLTVENQGVRNLGLALNGRRFHIDHDFDKGEGTVSYDISGLVRYGVNTLEVQALAKPGGTATLTVEAPALTARVMHTNDIHAAIDNLPKMAAYVKAAKAAGGNTFFINAGDNFSGNPVSDLNQGVPMIEVLNGMQVDLMAVGNHDFDHGPANTQARRSESNFPWLSANTVVADPSLTPIQPFEGYKVFETDLGQRIAFIGLTQTPPATGTKNIVGLRFESPAAHAQRLIAELRPQVNLLVVVSHNGHDWDTANAPSLHGTDLILGGHTHTYLSEPVAVAGIPIIQVGSGAANISDLVLKQTTNVAVTAGAAGDKYVVATSAMTAVDQDVQATVTRWKDLMAPVLNTKIGSTTRNMPSDGGKAYQDTALGNLITDGLRDYMGADIAVWNNGGIRASLPAGDITMNSIYRVLPFGNIPWKVEATGAQLVDFLSRSFSRQSRNVIDLQISGGSYVAYTKADGTLDHIALKIAGEPVDPTRVYTLAVSDFIATSSEYWSTMPTPVEMSSEVDAIAVAEYVRKLGTVQYAPTEGRILISLPTDPVAVTKLNFYNSSSLLAAGAGGALVPLTGEADVLVTAEATGYQADRSTAGPKNFAKVNAGTPVPLLALQQVGSGTVVASGAMLIANGYRTAYQNPQYFTNLLDRLTGTGSGTVLFDDGHGQFYGSAEGNLTQITNFLSDRGYSVQFTGAATALTAARLQNVQVLVISTPGSVGAYSADELALLQSYVTGGGKLILLSQTDFNNNSNPTELNRIAAAIGTAIRFNSDEVRDDTSRDGTSNFSPVTNEFNPNYPDLLKAR